MDCDFRAESILVPVLDDGLGRVYYGSIQIEQDAGEGVNLYLAHKWLC